MLVYMRISIVFNVISKDLDQDQIEKLKNFFIFYPRLMVCYKWGYKKY